MRSLFAFIKKEVLDQFRSSKLMILFIVFLVFGITNPALAKITPWLLENLSMEEQGVMITITEVDVMISWIQFYKNVGTILIAFILMEGNIFTKEYQSGTLILALTKGLNRYQVIFSKTIVLVSLWSIGFWMSYGITYAYNEYYWDNKVAKNLVFSAACWWQFGILVIMLIVLFSTLARENTGVFLGTGGAIVGVYLLSLIPKIAEFLPTMLMDGNSLIYAVKKPEDYQIAFIITIFLSIACFVMSIPILNKKQL